MKEQFDIIIVGTGAAGLFSALCIPTHLQILMLTKDSLENSDSYLAQGGISTLRDETDYDSYFEDTLKAGRYENNKESVRIMIEHSTEIINDLITYGVDFDRDKDGKITYTREGAHSTFRIMHHKDITGKEITSKLITEAQKRKNITILDYTTMVDLITENNTCFGVVTEDMKGNQTPFYSKLTVLATGGLGGLFSHSTNFPHITGDSFALALKHDIALEHIDYIQIHPTSLYSKQEGRRFLISEAVRGEGAILLNQNKERFVDELLPRDVVTNAIKEEMKKFNSKYVYLSLAHLGKDKILYRFPNIYEKCLEEGYDLARDMIPVTPAQHYLMGGIKVDTKGQTSMEHLFAVGETACNGVHGANRLASNSLLESLVFGKRAATQMTESIKPLSDYHPLVNLGEFEDKESRQLQDRQQILAEIKRRDNDFYDKWCNDKGQY